MRIRARIDPYLAGRNRSSSSTRTALANAWPGRAGPSMPPVLHAQRGGCLRRDSGELDARSGAPEYGLRPGDFDYANSTGTSDGDRTTALHTAVNQADR